MKVKDKLRVMAEAERRNAARVARHSAAKALREFEAEDPEDSDEGCTAADMPVATGDADESERGSRLQ